MPRTRAFPKPREFPRDLMLKLPSPEDCCTVAETVFWNQTMLMAQSGTTPRNVAEFCAQGLDDPLLVRAYPVIRDSIRRWAEMGDTWQDFDQPAPQQTATKPTDNWYEPIELWPDS